MILKRQENEEDNDCLLMVKKLDELGIEDVIIKLKQSLTRTVNFWINTYKGFYCSICDASNHRYFSVTQKKVFFSE